MYSAVKDSGQRTTFSTGSVRDVKTGKGRYDLLPAYAIKRFAQHYENGAVKYGDENWRKGQNLRNYLDSAIRHVMNYLEGQRDEDHLAATLWNIAAVIETEEMIRRGILPRELNDLPDWTEAGVQDADIMDGPVGQASPSLGDGAFTYLGSDPEREHAAATQQRWQDAAEAQPLDGYYVQHAPEYRTKPLTYRLIGQDVYLVPSSGTETLMPPGYNRRTVTPWIVSGQWRRVGTERAGLDAIPLPYIDIDGEPRPELDLDACGTIDGVSPIPLPYLARYAGGWNDSHFVGDHWLINDAGEVFYGSVGSWDESVLQLGEIQERIETGQWKRCDTEGKFLKLLPGPGLKYDGHWNDLDDDPNHYVIADGAVAWEDGTVWRRDSDDRYAEAADLIEVGSWFRCDVNGKRL